MRRSLIGWVGLVVVLGLTAVALGRGSTTWARTETVAKACSNRTLDGDYGFTGRGHVGPQEFLNVGVVSFDGRGGFQLRDTLTIVGVAAIPRTISGTYTVTADCRGTVQFLAPPPVNVNVTLQLVLVDHAREAYFIQTGPTDFFHGVAKFQQRGGGDDAPQQ